MPKIQTETTAQRYNASELAKKTETFMEETKTTKAGEIINRLGNALHLALAEIDCGADEDTEEAMTEIRKVYADFKLNWEGCR